MWSYIGFFLMGLGLNGTPCVYPMLAVTVSLFQREPGGSPLRALGRALLYCLGIATMYTALGVAAAWTGSLFGFLLSNRWVLSGIAGGLAVLAGSMFGLYRFGWPHVLVAPLGRRARANLLGLYLSGLFVGIFAAPCVAPPILTLLSYVGTERDPLLGFLAFFSLSLGLSAPYLVLGTSVRLLRRLPKSGEWTVWVEKIFGLVILAFAFFYLALAFRPGLVRFVLPGACMAGGVYLTLLAFTETASPHVRRAAVLIGIAGMVAGLGLLAGSGRKPLDWQPYTGVEREAAARAGKPVVIDFYADWCLPCHELERFTFSDPRVSNALRDFVTLRVDLSNGGAPGAREAAAEFRVLGIPTLVFLDRRGKEWEKGRVLGFMGPEDFLARVDVLRQGEEP